MSSFPYEAIASKRYKSPHKNDLSFAKGDRIRVLSLAPKDAEEEEEDDDDEEPDQWLVGETLDGTKSGTFPASHVQPAPAETSAPIEESIAVVSAKISTDNLSKEGSSQELVPSEEPPAESSKLAAEDAPAVAQTEAFSPSAKVSTPIIAPETQEETSPAPASEPSFKPKPLSPSIAPKPSGLAARIAAFNKPQEAPPPIPKGKPGAWKRPAPAPGAAKPVLPGPPAARQAKLAIQQSNTTTTAVSASSPPPVNSEEANSGPTDSNNAGFSAADAQSSIKMSLKERMAALQRGDSSNSAASKPAAPLPKPAPGRIAEEKRRAALAGVGSAAPSKSEEVEKASEEPVTSDVVNVATTNDSSLDDQSAESEAERTEAVPMIEGGDEVEAEDKTDEEVENERRQAIAKRMAALGGRRMGGGPALFGAPAPPSPFKKVSSDASQIAPQVNTEEILSEEPTALSTSVDQKELDEEATAQLAQTLAVPRRAAPPRKKKNTASSVYSTESQGIVSQEPSPSPRQNSITTNDVDPEKTLEAPPAEEKLDAGEEQVSEEINGAGLAAGVVGSGLALERNNSITQDSSTFEVTSSYDDQASNFEPGTPLSERQMDENARQLEDFIRTPREEEGDKFLEQAEEEENPAAPRPIPVASPPPPNYAAPSAIGWPPSSRPPSTRPPIPKATAPIEDETIQRTYSPVPTRAPPVPSVVRKETISDADSKVEGLQEEGANEQSAVEVQQPKILAKPKPRMAVPAELSHDEEGDGDDDDDEAAQPRGASIVPEPIPAAERSAESEEMTEEEEDRQRRARIAAKMAKMGGQPIMGAPIPFKKPSIPAPAPPPPPAEEAEAADYEDEPEEADQVVVPPTTAAAPSTTRIASPPPIPTSMSPPPIPTKSPPPVSSLDKRLSQMSTSDDTSLGRRASLLSRPPVPAGNQSRQGSVAEYGSSMAEDSTNMDNAAITPPPLPVSPPRAPPPRAPSRQPTVPLEETASASPAAPLSEEPRRSSLQQQQQPRRSASRSSRELPRSSRDLDLMPSSRWWRHGLPVKPPPTLMRPDAHPIVSTEDQGHQHFIRIELIFEDYSLTIVEVQYKDDDAAEEATQLSQRHNFPPARPSSAMLQSWSQRYGASVAKQAIAALQSKTIVGNGSSKGFISALIAAVGEDEILPPVGSSFGSIILAQAATTPVDLGTDEIRIGDIVALHGVDLKGKKGLTPYHTTFGNAQDPTYACVIESEAKKRKLRCILIAGIEGKKNKAPEEVSLRLDDVKSGLLRVFRLAPKSGWLSV